ncbi:hypothetical protein [Prosthecobacter sp.]|uniref:hypothetical protein n=1 Tax=Prosthecobacter sp. TaxID=1965333 RepID=UPI0037C62C49
MKTTVTLDADVAAQLRLVMKLSGATFKETLNDAVRAGLPSRPKMRKKTRQIYVLKPRDLGMRADVLPSHLLAAMDDEADFAKLRVSQ